LGDLLRSTMPTKIVNENFEKFLKSKDTIRVYKGDKLIFSSQKERLLPLLEYAKRFVPNEKDVIVFDRVVGNAAVLLLKKILCSEVFSPLGSEMAVKALYSFGIKYHFTEIVPCIQDDTMKNMCPMEKMSLGKTSEEFYQALNNPQKSK
jgi:hypothetical protein